MNSRRNNEKERYFLTFLPHFSYSLLKLKANIYIYICCHGNSYAHEDIIKYSGGLLQNNGHMLQMYHMQGLIAKWFKIIVLKHEMLAFPTPLSRLIFLAFFFSYMSCGRD